jgi:hypothetical protein
VGGDGWGEVQALVAVEAAIVDLPLVRSRVDAVPSWRQLDAATKTAAYSADAAAALVAACRAEGAPVRTHALKATEAVQQGLTSSKPVRYIAVSDVQAGDRVMFLPKDNNKTTWAIFTVTGTDARVPQIFAHPAQVHDILARFPRPDQYPEFLIGTIIIVEDGDHPSTQLATFTYEQ